MDDIRLFLDLDMNIKLRKAIASISTFIHSKTEAEGMQEIEKAVTHLQDILEGLQDRERLRK